MAVTSRQIMDALKIKNVKTLTRWHQAGVIPEPTVELHPGGIGRIACWPDWVIKHCHVVKQLVDEGQTLNEIASTFGNDWAAIERRYRRKYVFAEVSAKMDLEHALADIQRSIDDILWSRLGAIRRRIMTTTKPVVAQDAVMQAIELVRAGYNPLLVLLSDYLVVVPDFMLGSYLAEHFKECEPLLVLPVFRFIDQASGIHGLPSRPTVRAATKVTKDATGGVVEERFEYQGDWSFSIAEDDDQGKR